MSAIAFYGFLSALGFVNCLFLFTIFLSPEHSEAEGLCFSEQMGKINSVYYSGVMSKASCSPRTEILDFLP